MYKFFILSGASSAGKTTSLNTLVESGLCEKALKYSEREERGSSDDIIHIDNIYDTSISCDVVYTKQEYSFDSKKERSGKILELLKN